MENSLSVLLVCTIGIQSSSSVVPQTRFLDVDCALANSSLFCGCRSCRFSSKFQAIILLSGSLFGGCARQTPRRQIWSQLPFSLMNSTYLTEEDAKLGRKVCIACGCCLLNAKSLDRHVSYMSTKADHEARRMSALAAIQHNTFCLECRDDFKSTQGLIGHVLQLHSSDAHRLLAPFLLDQLPLFASSISPDHVPDYPPSSRSAASTSTEDSAAVTSSASSSSSEPPKMRTCSICLAQCKPASFARHMNSHESPDKFRCGHPGCSFSTHRTDSMQNHEKQHNALGCRRF